MTNVGPDREALHPRALGRFPAAESRVLSGTAMTPSHAQA